MVLFDLCHCHLCHISIKIKNIARISISQKPPDFVVATLTYVYLTSYELADKISLPKINLSDFVGTNSPGMDDESQG